MRNTNSTLWFRFPKHAYAQSRVQDETEAGRRRLQVRDEKLKATHGRTTRQGSIRAWRSA